MQLVPAHQGYLSSTKEERGNKRGRARPGTPEHPEVTRPDAGPAPAADNRRFSLNPSSGRGRSPAVSALPTAPGLAARPRPLLAPPLSRASPSSSPGPPGPKVKARARPLGARLLGSGPAGDRSATRVSALAGLGPPGGMEGPRAAGGGDVSLHNFSARLWEQLVHFHVMRLTDSLFLWVGATPHLRNLAVAMCNRYVSAGPGRGEGAGGEGPRMRSGRS